MRGASMVIKPLQTEIIKCKEQISTIRIDQYDQKQYEQLVYEIFNTIFINYFNSTCPDKLEPTDYISKQGLEKIKRAKGLI